jgi:hypothetical protein
MSDARARYFQEISRAFLARRGAPFFLSPKDLALIERWEKAGFPLAVVLEGIERAFERRAGRTGLRGKVLALSFCEAAVRRAFDEHRDRKIGGRRPPASAGLPGKRSRVAAAVEEFLSHAEGESAFLRDVFLEARRALENPDAPAEALEPLDGRVDAFLLEASTPSDRDEADREVRLHHRGLPPAERAAVVETLLLKRLRQKYRVPYLSPFYY